MQLAFDSVSDLAQALVRAELAHGRYEEELGQGRDADWPTWYAQYIEREQAAAGTTKATSTQLTFASVNDLAEALLRAEQAHSRYQAQIGHEGPDWPNWYAQYFERELTGKGASA